MKETPFTFHPEIWTQKKNIFNVNVVMIFINKFISIYNNENIQKMSNEKFDYIYLFYN